MYFYQYVLCVSQLEGCKCKTVWVWLPPNAEQLRIDHTFWAPSFRHSLNISGIKLSRLMFYTQKNFLHGHQLLNNRFTTKDSHVVITYDQHLVVFSYSCSFIDKADIGLTKLGGVKFCVLLDL